MHWLFQFADILIKGIVILRVFGDHDLEREKLCLWIPHILYSVDSHARRGRVTRHMCSSNGLPC